MKAQTAQLPWETKLRTVWFFGAVFAAYVLLAGYPGLVASLYTPCLDPASGTCNPLQIQLNQLPALERYGISLQGYALYAVGSDLLVTIAMIGIGALIYWRKPADRMAWFVSLLLLVFGAFGMNESHTLHNPPLWLEWIYLLFVILKWPALGILFCTFPDGKFVPRWSWLLVLLFLAQLAFFMLPYPYNIENWPPQWALLELLIVYGSTVAVLVYRFFYVATAQQKQQIKWLAFGFATTLLLVLTLNLLPLLVAEFGSSDSFFQLLGPASMALAYLPIPVGIGIALLRYRLWDIDLVINRTLVYLALSASVLASYVLVVLGLSALFRVPNNSLISSLATALVAVLLQPLRLLLQRGVNRLMFGDRIDPYYARLTEHLTVELQRSRERLVTAREEERRRLRRDLHDGLGPLLSSQTLTLSAVKKQLRQNPEVAENLLVDAIAHAKEAVADIRRLVYALRPPTLDDLGLLAAVQEQVARYQASGLEITLDLPDALPAVEIACYRIVQEALTNIARHAQATQATIRLRVTDQLTLVVTDNGQGLPPRCRSGVGLSSMRERAEELGGTCRIVNLAEGGTMVAANIPISQGGA